MTNGMYIMILFGAQRIVWRTYRIAAEIHTPRSRATCPHTTTMPIFEGGKLKPGIYRIQNIVSQTYVDIREHTKELCCRPSTLLEVRKGLVSPRCRLAQRTFPIAVFSGKSYLRVLDILYAGYDVETCSSYSHTTETGDAVGTRRA